MKKNDPSKTGFFWCIAAEKIEAGEQVIVGMDGLVRRDRNGSHT